MATKTTTIFEHARAQHIGLFRQMVQGGRWNLYRAPGTDNVALMRSDAAWDVEPWPVMVHDVHAMTADMLTLRVQSIVRS